MIKNTSLKRNAILNAIKQCCATIFPFITFSYSSHILGSAQIGKFSFSQSIVSYFSLIAIMGVTDYAVREVSVIRDDKEKLTKFSSELFSINIITTIMSYILLIFTLVFWKKLNPYRDTILILSIQIMLTTVGADWINIAFEDFLFLTIRYVFVGILCVIAMFIVVRTPEDLIFYTVISVLSTSGGNLFNLFYIRRYVKLKFTLHLNVKRHIKPMLLLFCNSIALVVYLNSDMTILGIMETDDVVGVYSVSTKVYLMIKSLINAVIMTTIPRLTYMLTNGQKKAYKHLLLKIRDILLAVSLPVAVGIFFESENILYVLAGNEYVSGDIVLKIFSVTIFLAVFSCFFTYAVLIPNYMEKWFLISTIVAALLNVGLNFILIPYLSLIGAALTTFIAELTVFIFSLFFIKDNIFEQINKKDILSEIIGVLLIVVECIAINLMRFNAFVSLIISIGLTAVTYLIVLVVLKNTVLYK